MSVGIYVPTYIGIGDAIQFSSLPENYYNETGYKLVDVGSHWVFDHNPFVVRNEPTNHVENLWDVSCQNNYTEKHFLPSVSERTCCFFGIKNTKLRHPRLYVHEDEKLVPNQIVCHFDGKCKGKCPEFIVEQVKKNYEGFNLIQIGGVNDRRFDGFEYKLGLNIFDTAKLIAQSPVFIGVNSSMMNLACCYPRTNKRVILTGRNDLADMQPMDIKDGDSHWLDWQLNLFNDTENDIGVTFSYKKL